MYPRGLLTSISSSEKNFSEIKEAFNYPEGRSRAPSLYQVALALGLANGGMPLSANSLRICCVGPHSSRVGKTDRNFREWRAGWGFSFGPFAAGGGRLIFCFGICRFCCELFRVGFFDFGDFCFV